MKFEAFIAFAAVTSAAQAQAPAAADQNKPVSRTEVSAKLDADYADLDADKNGKVDAAEINARLVKSAQAQIEAAKKERDGAFAKLDTNADGTLTKAEWEAGVKIPVAKEPDAKPFLDRFDANKDGGITREEFRAPTLANFEKLDSNKDGNVTPDEVKNASAAPTPRAKPGAKKETPPIGR
ncbi:MAG TPA: EF-hand domain-containing protein [Sphingomicrobium sp.]|nr:EF-hand domain-containing protein [Sphingomicrobium sp.]